MRLLGRLEELARPLPFERRNIYELIEQSVSRIKVQFAKSVPRLLEALLQFCEVLPQEENGRALIHRFALATVVELGRMDRYAPGLSVVIERSTNRNRAIGSSPHPKPRPRRSRPSFPRSKRACSMNAYSQSFRWNTGAILSCWHQ